MSDVYYYRALTDRNAVIEIMGSNEYKAIARGDMLYISPYSNQIPKEVKEEILKMLKN